MNRSRLCSVGSLVRFVVIDYCWKIISRISMEKEKRVEGQDRKLLTIKTERQSHLKQSREANHAEHMFV